MPSLPWAWVTATKTSCKGTASSEEPFGFHKAWAIEGPALSISKGRRTAHACTPQATKRPNCPHIHFALELWLWYKTTSPALQLPNFSLAALLAAKSWLSMPKGQICWAIHKSLAGKAVGFSQKDIGLAQFEKLMANNVFHHSLLKVSCILHRIAESGQCFVPSFHAEAVDNHTMLLEGRA